MKFLYCIIKYKCYFISASNNKHYTKNEVFQGISSFFLCSENNNKK